MTHGRRLIVFDLDGTLVDSRRDLASSMNALLAEYGAPQLPEHAIGRMVGDGAPTLVSRAFAATAVPQPDDALERFLAIYNEHLLDHTRPYPGIPDVLRELGARAAIAVLTNKPLASTRRVLAGLDLARHFTHDGVIGGDGPFARKPDPAGLQHLMEQAGAAPPATTLVGDSAIDWRTGRNASVGVCLVRYGFGFEGVQVDRLSDGEMVIDTPQDLLKVL